MTEDNRDSCIERTDDLLRFRCGGPCLEPSECVSVECVLDFDGMGNIIGVEILSFRRATGRHVLRGYAGTSVSFPNGAKFSYDDEVDAFYLSLSEGRSLDQRVEDCEVLLDEHGQFIGIEIDLG